MAEHRHDFLHVMRHQHNGRRASLPAETIEELKEMVARDRIEPGARLVENQHRRTRHQRATDKHTLAFALREKSPRPPGEIIALNLFEDARGASAVGMGDSSPKINHGVFAADDGFERRLGFGHHLAHGRADQTDLLAQLAPIGFAVAPAQHGDFAAGRSQIARERAEQRRFARTVGAEDDPVLAALDAPRNAVENPRLAAPAVQAANSERRFWLALPQADTFVLPVKEAKQMRPVKARANE